MSLLPIAEALARIFALSPRRSPVDLPLADAAHRYAAADVLARRTQPTADLSAMDGYAVRHADLAGPLHLVGESAAGRPFPGTVREGEAVRIFTGAYMPAGADCVLVQEEAVVTDAVVSLDGDGPSGPGRNVRRRGLDFDEGTVLIAAGDRITPARLAVAAIGGHATLSVRPLVRVAIAATGDELVPAGSPDRPGTLPESNGVMLAAMLADLPVTVIDLGILPDRQDVLEQTFRAVDADVLVTTGGASVGDHDLVQPALVAAGATIDFWRIALRPGKPMMAGRLGSTTVLGLPGNPVSAFVTCELFVKPLIRHLSGDAAPLPRPLTAPLGEALPANGERTDYLRGELVQGAAFASTIQDSSMLRTLARSTCLIVRPPHAAPAEAGDSAEILLLA